MLFVLALLACYATAATIEMKKMEYPECKVDDKEVKEDCICRENNRDAAQFWSLCLKDNTYCTSMGGCNKICSTTKCEVDEDCCTGACVEYTPLFAPKDAPKKKKCKRGPYNHDMGESKAECTVGSKTNPVTEDCVCPYATNSGITGSICKYQEESKDGGPQYCDNTNGCLDSCKEEGRRFCKNDSDCCADLLCKSAFPGRPKQCTLPDCVECSCSHWDGKNYSNCRSVNKLKCGDDWGLEFCVKCTQVGNTVVPMKGGWTTHEDQCGAIVPFKDAEAELKDLLRELLF